ncbi:putative inorganic phosphate cotransporter [Chrysoperla carnea]|uniref:putative inorganic phosphate cotransporter n=1 Tax=Chrysoperla carnea TaxID=189513 RepID=UPI001D09728A|nr:putative inorganic phosphate cotransporter [Chrysoperla carnea]
MSGTRKGENRAKNGHILVWDQPGIQEPEYLTKKKKGNLGTRHFVTFMLFLGMANAYIMRTNMSVAIVAMVNHTALPKQHEEIGNECGRTNETSTNDPSADGEYVWDTTLQGYILSSFFYGYVITQIPFGILAKQYGSKHFLGYGMLINSVFSFFVPYSANMGVFWLCVCRFIQGLGEGPVVPCTHALLAKWVPPDERSRLGAFVYAGAQFGTIISMPLSGLLSKYGFAGGWPSIFFVFGIVGVIWSLAFIFYVSEDPDHHKSISPEEKKHIQLALWGDGGQGEYEKTPPIPWRKIFGSLPFWAILLAHIGQNYGYETLMTELPTFMKQILHFRIESNGFLSALPYLAMWIFSIVFSNIADWIVVNKHGTIRTVRTIMNSIGEFSPALALVAASYTGCNPVLTVALLTMGIGFNGGVYSGFKINHLDISPRFAGILMSITNCMSNLVGICAPIIAGYLIKGKPTQAQWQKVFFLAAIVYTVCAIFYALFCSGTRQEWDNPPPDDPRSDEENQVRQQKKKNSIVQQTST